MKSPAFQFYPADWLSSDNITLMTPAQEGAYIRLLAYAWNDPDCSIPDDDEQLAILSRLGEVWLNGGSTLVRKCFVAHKRKPDRLVNLRLLEEREKQEAWRLKSAEGGRKSAQQRRKAVKGGSTTVSTKSQQVVQPNGNSSSSFSSSSSTSLEEKNNTGAHAPSSFFGIGVNILMASGVTEKNARSFLGKMVKDHGKEAVAIGIAKASLVKDIAEPVAYLTRLIKGEERKAVIPG